MLIKQSQIYILLCVVCSKCKSDQVALCFNLNYVKNNNFAQATSVVLPWYAYNFGAVSSTYWPREDVAVIQTTSFSNPLYRIVAWALTMELLAGEWHKTLLMICQHHWLSPAIVRWWCFHPVCLFVCVSVYVCHDVCPDDLAMKDWCHTNNILQVYYWGCLVVQVIFNILIDIIDDVTRSQNRSNFEIAISLSIFELEHRSKAQNVGHAKDYLSGIFNFLYHLR